MLDILKDIAVTSILRDVVAKQENRAGVPFSNKAPVWPERPTLRPASSSSPNGGDYVTFRRALHSRYSTVWLLSLHDQDPARYAEFLFDACVDFEKVQSLDTPVDGVASLKRTSVSISCLESATFLNGNCLVGIKQTTKHSALDYETVKCIHCVQRF